MHVSRYQGTSDKNGPTFNGQGTLGLYVVYVRTHTGFVSGSELYLDPYAKDILHRSLYEFLQGGSNYRKHERMR